MNILVSCMGYDGGKSGISSYMRNVVGELKNCGHPLTLILEDGSQNDFPDVEKIVVPRVFSKSARGFLWHLFALPLKAKNKKYDCLLILAANRRFVAFGKIPTIGVVHDLSQYRVEGKYDGARMFYLKYVQPFLGRKLSSLAAISKSTKDDVIKYWKVESGKVELNYNGLNPLAEPDCEVLKKLNLKKYIFYVSRIEHPGKNHIGLIKAYEALPDKLGCQYKLVFTGADWSGADEVKNYVSQSKDKENIIFSGFVTNQELSALYKNASAFVFPSFSEGFGLPLVEAMSAGVPTACSNDSALDEIGADAAFKFNPYSIDEIRKALFEILTNEKLRTNLVEKGLSRAKDFDWKKHAETLVKLCQKEYEKNSEREIFGIKFANLRMYEIVQKLSENIQNNDKKIIAFINTHYLNTAYEDPSQAARLNEFDYVLPDGSGVSLACKILGIRYRDNLNGTDLLPNLCKLAEEKKYKMYFLGGKENVATRAAENLKKLFPSLQIVGARMGYFSKEQESAIIDEINQSKADFLFVGFGAKLQEKWVLENRERLNCKLIFAIGGVCDVYSGDLFRVNPKLRKIGLEWLGRLYQDPFRLFGRYVLGNPLFVLRVVKSKLFKSKK